MTSSWPGPSVPGQLHSGRLPNFPLPKPQGTSLNTLCWNANALYHSDLVKRGKKLKELRKFCTSFHVIGLEEVHGNRAALREMLGSILNSHLLFHSPFETDELTKEDTGGVAFLVSKEFVYPENFAPNFAPNFASNFAPRFDMTKMFKILVPGRVARVAIPFSAQGSFAYTVVHNYGLASAQLRTCENSINKDIDRAHRTPDLFGFCLLGDFNIEPSDETRFHISNPDEGIVVEGLNGEANTSRPFQKRWEKIFGRMVGLKFPNPSHYISSDVCENRIDRIFGTVPRSALVLLNHRAGAIKSPALWHLNDLSDHAPIFWKISFVPSSRVSDGNLRIPSAWSQHPKFTEKFKFLYRDVQPGLGIFSNLNEKCEFLVMCKREAARHVRDLLFLQQEHSTENSLLRLCSIARAAWNNDMHLGGILVTHSELARRFLNLDDGIVTLLEKPAFEETLRDAKERHFAGQRRRINDDFKNVKEGSLRALKKGQRHETNNRLSYLWKEMFPTLALGGVKI